MTPERVAGVVLAAGQSTRMGRNKMLLEIGGRTLVRRAVTTAFAAGLDPVLVVVGHESDKVRGELSGLPCTPVLNGEYASGMNTSLRSGTSTGASRRWASTTYRRAWRSEIPERLQGHAWQPPVRFSEAARVPR